MAGLVIILFFLSLIIGMLVVITMMNKKTYASTNKISDSMAEIASTFESMNSEVNNLKTLLSEIEQRTRGSIK